MTMLTHPDSEPASCLANGWETANTTADLAVLKLFSVRAVRVLVAGGGAGIIALEAAIFLSRIND